VVVDSHLSPTGAPFLSVSQVETAFGNEGCLFKWGQRYLARNLPPRDGSADLGTRIHEINQTFMETGAEPDYSETLTLWHKRRAEWITYQPALIWKVGMPLLPPRERVKCEGKFQFTTSIHGDPVYWRGAKDMEWQDSSGLWHVGDLKTSVSFTYQKTEEKLRADWQGNLYAYEAMQRHGVKAVALDWFTYITDPTKTRECRPTSIVVLYPEVYEIVAAIEGKGRVLLSHYARPLIVDRLPKNRSACQAFGGCPYLNSPACPAETLEEMFDMPLHDDFLQSMTTRLAPPPQPWRPGDPLNSAQEYLQNAGAPLSAIANAADVPPLPEVAAGYVPPPPPPPPVLPWPPVESGLINPPESKGLVAPLAPEDMAAPPITTPPPTPPMPDDLDTLDREEIKALGVELGLFDAHCRWQIARMREAVRAKRKSNGLQGIAPPVEETPTPPVPFIATPAPDGLEMQQISETRIRQIVREELRALFVP
jgi:hypothetical protein